MLCGKNAESCGRIQDSLFDETLNGLQAFLVSY